MTLCNYVCIPQQNTIVKKVVVSTKSINHCKIQGSHRRALLFAFLGQFKVLVIAGESVDGLGLDFLWRCRFLYESFQTLRTSRVAFQKMPPLSEVQLCASSALFPGLGRYSLNNRDWPLLSLPLEEQPRSISLSRILTAY